MTAINFPDSPSDGDTHTVGGVTYTYNNAETKWKTTINSNAFLPLSGGTVSGTLTVNDDLAVDTDTLFVDVSNDRVGINTTSPGAPLDIVSNSSAEALRLRGRSADEIGSIYFQNNAGSTNYGYIQSRSTYLDIATETTNPIIFTTNQSERMRLLSGGGLTFNGDTATANALDDYEEGTWEPTLTTAGGDFSSVTYHGDTGGRYTKIGQRVYLNGCVRITALTIGSVGGDALYIGGLPFASAQRSDGDNADDIGPLTTTVWTGGASSGIRPTHTQIIHNQNTQLRVWFYNPGSGTAQNVQGNDIGSTINIFISLVYTAS